MEPTCFGVLPQPAFKERFPFAPEGIPRGDLLRVSVNPFNGQFVYRFHRTDAGIRLVEYALDDLDFQFGAFGNFARPIIEAEPRYALRAAV